MRSCGILLTLGCWLLPAASRSTRPWQARPVRTVVVDPKPIHDDRQAVGEVKPRYESDLSFRVAGKLVSRLVDVGAAVKQGDILATLDVQDYQNRLRSAEADVGRRRGRARRGAGHRRASRQAVEERLDAEGELRHRAAQSALRRGQARLRQGQSRSDPRPAQLHRAQGRIRRRHHRRRRRSGPECHRRPDGGEARPPDRQGRRIQHRRDRACRSPQRGRRGHRLAAVQPAADDRRRGAGDLAGRRPDHAHLHREGHAQGPAAADPLRHEHRRPLEGQPRAGRRAAALRSVRKERRAGCVGRSISNRAASR